MWNMNASPGHQTALSENKQVFSMFALFKDARLPRQKRSKKIMDRLINSRREIQKGEHTATWCSWKWVKRVRKLSHHVVFVLLSDLVFILESSSLSCLTEPWWEVDFEQGDKPIHLRFLEPGTNLFHHFWFVASVEGPWLLCFRSCPHVGEYF